MQTFVFYRILGNDLPPRHGTGQTVKNVQFILEHEPEFPGCEKRWLLNRISDERQEAELRSLLDAHGQTYRRIPFHLAEFARTFLDADWLPDGLNAMAIAYGKLPRVDGLAAFRWIHRTRNLYAINNNGARNAALNDGLKNSTAQWIMPWDGSCFLTASGFEALARMAEDNPEARYLVVPVHRLADNGALFDPAFAPMAEDEPQVAFHRDARGRFDLALPYGESPKADFLVRIGVPGPWNDWYVTRWEPRAIEPIADKDRFVVGSWVARLQSYTAPAIEGDVERVWLSRHDGVARLCQKLDELIVRSADKSHFLKCYPQLIDRAREGKAAVHAVLAAGDAFLLVHPPTVTEKAKWPQGASPHDYASIARYERDAAGNRLDGVVAAGADPSAPQSADYDRYRWQTMVDGVTALTLAARVSGDPRYAAHAAQFVRVWFLDEGTRMAPHARFAQHVPRGSQLPNAAGIVDFRDVWALCDALRMLAQDAALSGDEVVALRKWFEAFVSALGERGGYVEQSNNVAVFHDVIAASAAAFCGAIRVTAAVLGRASLRIHRQTGPWGWQPGEADRAAPLHYALFGVQAQIALAWLARNCGIDLWAYSGRNHRSIPMAIRHIALNRHLFADYDSGRDKFDDRIEVALRAIPSDAADVAVLRDVPRRALANPEALGAAEGLPPWWSYLLANAGDGRSAGIEPFLPFSGISVTYTRPVRAADQSP